MTPEARKERVVGANSVHDIELGWDNVLYFYGNLNQDSIGIASRPAEGSRCSVVVFLDPVPPWRLLADPSPREVHPLRGHAG